MDDQEIPGQWVSGMDQASAAMEEIAKMLGAFRTMLIGASVPEDLANKLIEIYATTLFIRR